MFLYKNNPPSYVIFFGLIVTTWATFYTDYDSDTEDEDDELKTSPPTKRQKIEADATASGSSTSSPSENSKTKDGSCLPFLLTSVRGIPSEFNARNLAVSIKGIIIMIEL